MNDQFSDAGAPAFLSGGGEMGARMRDHDWSTSPLSYPSTWPQSLRSLVSVVLRARQPMFVAWGPDLAFLYNDDYAPIFAARHPYAMGRPFAEVWSDIWPQIEPLAQRTLAGEASFHNNLLIPMERQRGLEDAWFTFSYTPASDETGAIAGILCVATETTGQVNAERTVRESEARFRNVADNSPVIMWVTDPTGYCTYLNRRWYEYTGQSEAEGEGYGWLNTTHPDDKEEAGRIFLEANARQEPFRLEYRLRRADGTYRWAIDAAAPRFGHDGQYLGYVGSVIDIDERRESEEHLRLMVNELNHRVKNSLATVQAIASQTFRDTSTFASSKVDFSARIMALSRAHDLLTESNWSGATMRQVIDRTVGPHGDNTGPRFDIDGPHVRLSPKTALSLSMAIHELCTNAAKYGALSVDTGHVGIAWRVDGGPDGRRLMLTWIERDGPAVSAPTRRGFGSRLIERNLAAELDGEVEIRYEPTGVVCTIDAPLPNVR